MNVALVGCGARADTHLSQLANIKQANVVAVCDPNEDLVYQAAERFRIDGRYTDMHDMVCDTRPDVVHITTNTASHIDLAIKLLNSGCHLYIESPFTKNSEEAREVLSVARRQDRQVCVGHDQLFDPIWLKGKIWILNGLIGQVNRVESILGISLDQELRSLDTMPGTTLREINAEFLHNLVTPPLTAITDFMSSDDQPRIYGGWYAHGRHDFPTELHIALQSDSYSGQLAISSLIPPQRIARIYGTNGTLELDFDAQTLVLHNRLTSGDAFAKLDVANSNLWNSLWNLTTKMWRFARKDLNHHAGMKTLIEQFYDSLLKGTRLPISQNELLHITQLTDRIFAHCQGTEDMYVRDLRTIQAEMEDAVCLTSHV